jgi:hypothetical protein
MTVTPWKMSCKAGAAIIAALFLAGCGGNGTGPTPASSDTKGPGILNATIHSIPPKTTTISSDPAPIVVIDNTRAIHVTAQIIDPSGLNTTTNPPSIALYDAGGLPFNFFEPMHLRASSPTGWEYQNTIGVDPPKAGIGLKTVVLRAVDTLGNQTVIPIGTVYFGLP